MLKRIFAPHCSLRPDKDRIVGMEITGRDDNFFCWGSHAQGGVYLLRLTVAEPLDVCFGRFQNGRPIQVAAGDYLYVGSAMAARGAASLARRLLRHASRQDSLAPHCLRHKMRQLFAEIGLGPTPLLPPTGKKLRWHIDFLLEETAVSLTTIYIIREAGAGPALEAAVARSLLALPEIAPLAAGLGSSDDPGGTHLLRVAAGSGWWAALPDLLTTFLKGVPT